MGIRRLCSALYQNPCVFFQLSVSVDEEMRNILITNDDGIRSGGIIRLAEAAKAFGRVFVVAPAEQRSALSQSITLRNHIDVYPVAFPVKDVQAFACSGTPADCVRVGSLNVMPVRPDVVLSGINFGYNVASDIQYSATAGAAFEAAFQGYRAIALSEDASECHEVTDAYLLEVLGKWIDADAEKGRIININFPGCLLSDCRGVLEDRKVSESMFYRDRYNVAEELPGGGMRLMVEGIYSGEAEEGTDFHAVINGYVSVGIVSNIK